MFSIKRNLHNSPVSKLQKKKDRFSRTFRQNRYWFNQIIPFIIHFEIGRESKLSNEIHIILKQGKTWLLINLFFQSVDSL